QDAALNRVVSARAAAGKVGLASNVAADVLTVNGETVQSKSVDRNNRRLTLMANLRVAHGVNEIAIAQGGDDLDGVFRSTNAGDQATAAGSVIWTAMGAAADADGGIKPSFKHFSMAAHPVHANLAYVAGATPPTPR